MNWASITFNAPEKSDVHKQPLALVLRPSTEMVQAGMDVLDVDGGRPMAMLSGRAFPTLPGPTA